MSRKKAILCATLILSCGPSEQGRCLRPPVEQSCLELSELELAGAPSGLEDLESCRFACLRLGTLRLNSAASRPSEIALMSRIKRVDFITVETPGTLVDLSGLPALETPTRLNVTARSLSAFGELPPDFLRSISLGATSLTSFSGLSGQKTLRSVFLESNSFTSLEGLPKGLSEPITFELQRDSALESTAGLAGVRISTLGLSGAARLRSLEGIDLSNGIQQLTIMNNPALPQCEALALAQRIGVSTANIRNNKPCP